MAEFDPSGRWLVVADRGLDRLFVIRLDPGTGALTLHEPGDRLYAANQASGTIVAFAVDTGTGRLRRIGAAPHTGTPTFVLLNEPR